jgi:hypothetical protein
MVEGMFYFFAYMKTPSLAQKWRDYAVYKDFQKVLKDGPEAAAQMLTETAQKSGAK